MCPTCGAWLRKDHKFCFKTPKSLPESKVKSYKDFVAKKNEERSKFFEPKKQKNMADEMVTISIGTVEMVYQILGKIHILSLAMHHAYVGQPLVSAYFCERELTVLTFLCKF